MGQIVTLDFYLCKDHGKEALKILASSHQEEANTAHWENNTPLYSYCKAAKDIINEKSFVWIKLTEDFSIGPN